MFVTQSVVGAKKEGNILRREQDSFAVGVFFWVAYEKYYCIQKNADDKIHVFIFFARWKTKIFRKLYKFLVFSSNETKIKTYRTTKKRETWKKN